MLNPDFLRECEIYFKSIFIHHLINLNNFVNQFHYRKYKSQLLFLFHIQ